MSTYEQYKRGPLLRHAQIISQLPYLNGDHDGDGVALEAVPVNADVLHQGMRLQLGLHLPCIIEILDYHFDAGLKQEIRGPTDRRSVTVISDVRTDGWTDRTDTRPTKFF